MKRYKLNQKIEKWWYRLRYIMTIEYLKKIHKRMYLCRSYNQRDRAVITTTTIIFHCHRDQVAIEWMNPLMKKIAQYRNLHTDLNHRFIQRIKGYNWVMIISKIIIRIMHLHRVIIRIKMEDLNYNYQRLAFIKIEVVNSRCKTMTMAWEF